MDAKRAILGMIVQVAKLDFIFLLRTVIVVILNVKIALEAQIYALVVEQVLIYPIVNVCHAAQIAKLAKVQQINV
jgi:hypothetical protein